MKYHRPLDMSQIRLFFNQVLPKSVHCKKSYLEKNKHKATWNAVCSALKSHVVYPTLIFVNEEGEWLTTSGQ